MPSSVVAAYKYFEEIKTLRINYVSGRIYDYKNVPEKIYKALKTATSKGSYLNRNIKGKYAFEQVVD